MDQLKLCMSKSEQVNVRITSGRNMLSHGFCSEVSIYMRRCYSILISMSSN